MDANCKLDAGVTNAGSSCPHLEMGQTVFGGLAYKNGNVDFENNYFALLSAGGSKSYKELLKPFNLNASDPEFWAKGLGLISTMIDELEDLGT